MYKVNSFWSNNINRHGGILNKYFLGKFSGFPPVISTKRAYPPLPNLAGENDFKNEGLDRNLSQRPKF